MEYKQIQELVKMINKSNISELSIKDGEFEITIKQESNVVSMPTYTAQPMMMASAPAASPVATDAGTPALAAAAPVVNDKLHTIKSPMIGTFYRSPSPDKAPFVNVGDEVKPGQPLCIVEAMKLFNEIECEISGKIVKVLVDEATPIEYDQPMFIVELN